MDIEKDNILLRFSIILNCVVGNIDTDDFRNLVFNEKRVIRDQ